jgi:alpha-1,2-mannosyltransferase
MGLSPILAIAVFVVYIAVILLLFGLVLWSITPKDDKLRLFDQKPFLFLRCAVGALLSTWYCKLSNTYLCRMSD